MSAFLCAAVENQLDPVTWLQPERHPVGATVTEARSVPFNSCSPITTGHPKIASRNDSTSPFRRCTRATMNTSTFGSLAFDTDGSIRKQPPRYVCTVVSSSCWQIASPAPPVPGAGSSQHNRLHPLNTTDRHPSPCRIQGSRRPYRRSGWADIVTDWRDDRFGALGLFEVAGTIGPSNSEVVRGPWRYRSELHYLKRTLQKHGRFWSDPFISRCEVVMLRSWHVQELGRVRRDAPASSRSTMYWTVSSRCSVSAVMRARRWPTSNGPPA